jgi:hypothetical protein
VYHLKCNPTTITYCGTKMKLGAGPPPCNRLSQLPVTLKPRSPGSTAHAICTKAVQVQIQCIHKQNMCSFSNTTLHQNIHQAFSNVYPDKEAPNMTVCGLLIKFRTQEVFVCDKCSVSDKTTKIMVIINFKQCTSCNNDIRL